MSTPAAPAAPGTPTAPAAPGTPTAALVTAAVGLAAGGVSPDLVARTCLELGAGAEVGAVCAALAGRRATPEATAEAEQRLRRLGAVTVLAGHDGYPPRLARSWPDLGAPLWLFLAAPGGRLPDAPTVALVGSRRASLDGIAVATRLAAHAAQAGAVVLSGMAAGIDRAAHTAALEAGGCTVGVLGSGFGVDYPSGSAALRKAVAASGGLVTELLPGTPPRPHHFLHRNRIIAGLADVVVVVEGGARSGSLSTARHALEQGREVLACPGSLVSPHAGAALALMRDGAPAVTAPEEVTAALGLGGTLAGSAPALPDPEPPAGLTALARQVWTLLSGEPAGIDLLAEASGASTRKVLVAVAELVAAGAAHRGSRGVVRTPVGPAG